jgi:hypothetical protein
LQQVADLDVGVLGRGCPGFAAAANSVGLVEQQDGAASRGIEDPAQVLSVSPMYLLTTTDKSMR